MVYANWSHLYCELVQSFILTFLAEWGDRSQLATIAVGSPDFFIYVCHNPNIQFYVCHFCFFVTVKLGICSFMSLQVL